MTQNNRVIELGAICAGAGQTWREASEDDGMYGPDASACEHGSYLNYEMRLAMWVLRF